MAKAAAISFKEFRVRYSTEDACREELFRLRFPDGFVCPVCGCREYYPIHGRNTFQCRACRHQTSVTSGTVMHRTRLPLTVWFWAIYLCATDKRGVSAVQLSRTLGICYDSAWHLLDKIRTAMGQRDETTSFLVLLSWMTAILAVTAIMASVAVELINLKSWSLCPNLPTVLLYTHG